MDGERAKSVLCSDKTAGFAGVIEEKNVVLLARSHSTHAL